MIHIISLSDDDCLYAIEQKEFSDAILNAGENVAVVMSQDWCPQWLQMKRFLNDEAYNQTIEITAFVVEYRVPRITQFSFKLDLFPSYFFDRNVI